MRRPLRAGFAVAIVGAVAAACGLDLVGSGGVSTPAEDAGHEAGPAVLPDGATDDGNVTDLDSGPDPFLDAGLDVSPANCLAVCDGGTCEGGVCRIACVGSNACANDRVVCPPGVPCEVNCAGSGACGKGVDCLAASACKVACTGSNACANDAIDCSGTLCQTDCVGSSACASGVRCDAGSCNVQCKGASACGNAPVLCEGATCGVRCGSGTDDSRGACANGVTCSAVNACEISCLSRETCRNSPVVAFAGDASTVKCTAQDTCQGGVNVTAADASIHCQGNNACNNSLLTCDGGNCTMSCTGNLSPKFCCSDPPSTCNEVEMAGCNIGNTGCP